MKKRNLIVGGLLTFALSASLVGCGSSSANSSKASDNGPKKLENVGMTVMTLDNPYFVAFQKSLQSEAKKDGFQATIDSADLDLAKQQSQIEDFISQKVDVILLNAVDVKGVAGAVKEAVAAHIPVIAIDAAADGGTTATVMSDNYSAGKKAGEYVAKRLNGKGNVVVMNGLPMSSIMDRVQGFKDVMKKYPNIKIVAEQNGKNNRSDANTVFENVLSAHSTGTIDAVFGANDPIAIGSYLAAKTANRSDMFFAGVDGSTDAVNLIKENGTFAFTAAQHPFQEVTKAVELAQDIIDGKKVPKQVLIPVDGVSKDNVNTFKPEF